jgi:hypothetical protein
MRVRAIVVGLVLGAAALTASAEEPKLELKEYASKDGKYKVLLPGKVETRTEKDDDGPTITTAFASAGKDRAFTVGHFDLPKPVTPEKAKEMLKDMTKPLKDKGVKVTYDKELTVGPDKLPASEYLIEFPAGTFTRQRQLIAGNRMYTFNAVGPKEFVTSKDADKVFESFEVTK